MATYIVTIPKRADRSGRSPYGPGKPELWLGEAESSSHAKLQIVDSSTLAYARKANLPKVNKPTKVFINSRLYARLTNRE